MAKTPPKKLPKLSIQEMIKRKLSNTSIAIRPFAFIAAFAVIGGVLTLWLTHAATGATGTAVSGVGHNKCLDVSGNIRKAGRKVQLFDCNGTTAQEWTMQQDGTIHLANTNFCLDVRYASKMPKTPVWLWPCNGTVAQLWTVNYSTNTLINPHSGLCLDDRYRDQTNGNLIWMWQCNSTQAQIWHVPQIAAPTPSPTPSPSPKPSPSPVGGPAPSPSPTPSPVPTPTPTPSPAPVASTPVGQSGTWKLAFDDEFDGTSLDTTKWIMTNPSFQNPWQPYNNEQEKYRYTANNPNVQENGGALHLIATKENGQIYSGMISSGPVPQLKGSNWQGVAAPGYHPFQYTYGYFEGRVKLPKGNGFWPSMWMLPDQEKYGDWPGSGEYDMFEVPGNNPTDLHMTEHDGQNGGAGDSTVAAVTDLSAGYHVFGLDWEPTYIKWYLDGNLMKTYTNAFGIQSHPFYPIANFSVGGSWPPLNGAPDATTPFPTSMDIDYIRIFQH